MDDKTRNSRPAVGDIYRSTIDDLTIGKVTKIEGDRVTVKMSGERHDECSHAEFSDSWTWKAYDR